MNKFRFRALYSVLVVVCVGMFGGQAKALQYDLYAGQTTLVGYVEVINSGSNVTVTYNITEDGYCIVATHLDIAGDASEIPQNKQNNPKIGQFEFNDTWNCLDTASYNKDVDGDDPVYIAAHALVASKTTQTIVSSTNTQVVEVNGVAVGPQDAVAAKEPFNYPTCSAYTADDATKSVWDNGIGAAAYNAFTAAGADWIWNTPDPENPIDGDVVTFQEIISTPSGATPFGGNIMITADNGYRVLLNGDTQGEKQLGPGFPGTLKEDVNYPGNPQQGDWGVASQGWQTIETWPLTAFLSGDNTLTIVAANEFMHAGQDDYLSNYDPSAGPISQDPTPDATHCYNPGGLIFKTTVEYYSDTTTAWGDAMDGTPFGGNSWATYIEYDIE